MKFVKGDQDNLKGKALIYTTLKVDKTLFDGRYNDLYSQDGKVIAVYLTTDPKDLEIRAGTLRESSELSCRSIYIKDHENKAVEIYSSVIELDKFRLAKLLEGDLEDIIDAGSFSNLGRCIGPQVRLFSTTQLYLKNKNQKNQKLDQINQKKEKKKLEQSLMRMSQKNKLRNI